MVSPLFFYQLVLVALVWLCVMLHWAWPSDPAAVCPTTPEPPGPLPKHNREPTPVAGLTCKPPCAACEQAHEHVSQPPGCPPPRIVPTRGRPRQVVTSFHFCPNVHCDYQGWVGLGNLRANGLPTIYQPQFVNFLPHLHDWLTTHSACIIAGAMTQHGHKHTQQSVANMVVFQKWRWTEVAVTLGLVFVASIGKEWPVTFIAVRCPHCQSDHIVKRGKTARGTQRSLCQNTLCAKGSFLLDSCHRGCLPDVKHTIIDLSLNASGVRDTARSLHICPHTVRRELKKQETALESVHTSWLSTLHPDEVAWDMERAGEAEMDERWSFVGNKGNPRWLWHAIDPHTGKVLASVFGRRQDTVFLKRKALLEPFGITRYYTDYWGAYRRHLDPEEHSPGKRNTQKIERTHLTLRTRIKRLVRKTICFSKTAQMHDIVIGLFVNRYAFGRAV